MASRMTTAARSQRQDDDALDLTPIAFDDDVLLVVPFRFGGVLHEVAYEWSELADPVCIAN